MTDISYSIDETKLMMKLKRCKRRLKEQRHYSEYLKCKLAKKALQNQKLKERLWKNNCGMADRDAEIRRLTDELTSRNYLYGQRVDEITMLQHVLENSEYWKDKAIWRNKDKDAEIAKLNGWVDELIHLGEGAIIGYGTSPWNTLVTRINQERAHE